MARRRKDGLLVNSRPLGPMYYAKEIKGAKMACQKCKSERIMSINAKCSDMCFADINGNEQSDYPPEGVGIGGGDYVEFSYCLNCGQIQGDFPVDECALERGETDG